MLWYYTLQKLKLCYLLRDKNTNFAHLILISVSKLITLSKFTSTDILASLLMMNSTGSRTLHMYARQCPKKNYFYYLSSNTFWTFPSASCFIMLTFLLILHMPPRSRMDVVISYSKKLNSLHRRAAKLMLPDPSTTTETKIQRWVYSRVERNLCSARLY